MVDHLEFLNTIFAEAAAHEKVCVSLAVDKGDGDAWFSNGEPGSRGYRNWKPEAQAKAWYFCVSTVDGGLNASGTQMSRGRDRLVQYHCLVLDDVGTKSTPPPVEPSWKITTSIVDGVANEQWGYCLDPGKDFAKYEALVAWCAKQGWTDGGAGGVYRVMRVPGSANMKPGRGEFRAVCTHWDPTVWPLEELMVALGCTDDDLVVDLAVSIEPVEGGGEMAGIDPLLDWLKSERHVVKDNGEWVDIICPWADAHTSGSNTAGYSPLGRGLARWSQTRAFKCLHEHCLNRKFGDFQKWVDSAGGPYASGYDPLPWLQAKYVYVQKDMLVVDLDQRPHGGVWSWTMPEFQKMHSGNMRVPGRDKAVSIALAFVEDERTRTVVDMIYRPVPLAGDTGLVCKSRQQFANSYIPPNWAEIDETPHVFLDHISYLVPEAWQREIFLDWLAAKIQRPDLRSWGVVMVTDGVFGTGRSWIAKMMGKVLQGGVNTASLAQLYGKGTSAEQNYNDWQMCQYVVVEEAKESNLSKDDFYHGYETFKSNCDPAVAENQRVNPKYGRTRTENIYYNVMIFSNHLDAMCLPEDERRLFVIQNPGKKKDYKYYERLTGALMTQEPRRVYWWLMRRDVSKFDRIYPEDTAAKDRMIEDNRAPSDLIMDWMVEHWGPDLITKGTLKGAVALAARELDMDKAQREPGAMVSMIWKRAGRPRPDDRKNGARIKIDGRLQEVRSIRRHADYVDAVSVELWETEAVKPTNA